LSTVIGVTIFYQAGNALQVAGPAGALLSFTVVGILGICVMDCVSELIQMFPTPNAIVEFVRIFVDEDLAWVIGIGYWLDYIVPSLVGGMANLSTEGTPTPPSFQPRSLLLRDLRSIGIWPRSTKQSGCTFSPPAQC
jgi:hypothetical protein